VLTQAPRSSPSKSGDGVNYFFDFEAIQGPNSGDENVGRRVTMMISGKALDAGVGEVCAQYYGAMCALTGATPAEIKDQEIDESRLVGQKLWSDIQDRIVDGKTYKDFRQFSPSTEVPF
jgi:hypothetical protein